MAPSAKRLWELEFGKIYLVKGTLAQVQWELRRVPVVRYIVEPTKQELIDLTSSSFLEDDSQTIVVIPKDFDIPNVSVVDPDTRIMVVLAQPGGQLPDGAEKRYKEKSKTVLPVNILNRNRRNDTEIQMALNRIQDQKLRETIFKAYKMFPQTLIYKVRSGQYLQELETEEKNFGRSKEYLDSLLTDNWYKVWNRISKSDLWKFFWIPRNPKDSFMYRFLTGLNSPNEHRGFCPALWPFIEIAVSNCRNSKEIKFKLLVFASWVRAASTCFATSQKKGLYQYTGRQKFVGYSFEPSEEAINHFFSLFNYPIPTNLHDY